MKGNAGKLHDYPRKKRCRTSRAAALCRCSLFENSALLAEVGQTQTGGRLFLAVVAQAGNDQHDDRHDIGQDLVELRGDEGNLQAQIQDHQSAEQHGTPNGRERTPCAEDDQCDGQPADAGQTLVVPDAACDSRDVDHTADGGDTAADDGGQVLVTSDVDTGGVRGRRRFAHGAQIQAGTALVQVQVQHNGQNDREIEEEAVAEQDFAGIGNVLKELREGGCDEERLQLVADGLDAMFLRKTGKSPGWM